YQIRLYLTDLPHIFAIHFARHLLVHKRKLHADVLVLLAADFHIWINEVIQRLALLRWTQSQIAADRELNPIIIMRPEKVVFLFRMLPSLGNINRDPSILRIEELSPAVISSNFSGVLV